MIDPISVVYREIRTEGSWLIGQNAIYYKNKIGQQHDKLYRCGLWWKWYRTTTWLNIQVQSMLKNRHDNDVTNSKGVISIEYDTQVSWPIRQCAVYDDDQIWNRRDWSYNSALLRKQNWTIMIDLLGCGLWWRLDRTTMWQIVQVWSMSKSELNSHDRSSRILSITKIRHDNDVTNRTGAVYDENDIGLRHD